MKMLRTKIEFAVALMIILLAYVYVSSMDYDDAISTTQKTEQWSE